MAAGGKSAKKRIRLVAAIAACLAVFVFVCGCGYLPSINVILQTLFASGVGKDVEVHEVTYTFEGMIKEYSDLTELVSKEELDILLPENLPNAFYITDILNDSESNKIIVMFNDSNMSFHVYNTVSIDDLIPINDFLVYKNDNHIIYYKELIDASFIAYTEINNNVYYVQYNDLEFVKNILSNLR